MIYAYVSYMAVAYINNTDISLVLKMHAILFFTKLCNYILYRIFMNKQYTFIQNDIESCARNQSLNSFLLYTNYWLY